MLVVWLSLGSASAEPVSPDAALQALQQRYAKVDTVQAEFTQVVHSPVYGDNVQGGHVWLQRPKKMRWDFAGPQGQQYVSDGTALFVYNKAENQVFRYSSVSAVAGEGGELLQSLDTLGKLFEPKAVSELPNGGHALDLVPREPGDVTKLHLELSADWTLEKLVFTDAMDDTTSIAFHGTAVGAAIPASTFQFEIPPGAEVLQADGGP